MGTNTAYCEQVLILYDSSASLSHVGRTHTALLENLLGHFKVDVLHKPVSDYQAGDMDASLATFYLGVIFNDPGNCPSENAQLANYNQFLADASRTASTLVWLNYNIWCLEDYFQKNGQSLADVFGFSVKGISKERYNRVSYKGTELYKGVVSHANPGANLAGCTEEGQGRWACATELNTIEIVNPDKVAVLAKAYSSLNPDVDEKPYISRSGNFWFVGDLPTTHISEEDRYLVLADLLHEMLGIQHEEIHRALVRLEDVSAMTKESEFASICDYLLKAGIPFSSSVIAAHIDSTGEKRDFSQSAVGQYLSRMVNDPGGNTPDAGNNEVVQPEISIVAHGYTHQSDFPDNPYDGVSGSDFEFFRVTTNQDNSLNFVGPLPVDVDDWAYRRMQNADKELKRCGLTPFAWSAPHYLASARAYAGIHAVYPIHYGRTTYFIEKDNGLLPVGQFFPYPIHRDTYGYRIVPENTGHYSPEPIPGFGEMHLEDIIRNASKNLVVRDGYASFFYHPPQGVAALKQTVESIQALGYEFVDPKSIFPATQPEGDTDNEPEPQSADETSNSNGCFLLLSR